MARKTGFIWHERMMWHDCGPSIGTVPSRGLFQQGEHFENPETKRRLKNLMDAYGVTPMLQPLAFAPADEAMLGHIHPPAYLNKVKALSDAGGGDAGEFAIVGAGSYEIAMMAPSGVLAAAEAVLGGEVDNAYVLSRPPGHHAEPEQGRGFCIFANTPIAIRELQARGKVNRVAVVDWDVHHGNGTEACFYDDPSVLTISIHQDGLYPADKGGTDACGAADGAGFNINVPLPPGSGEGAYYHAMSEVVLPALEAFRPDMIFIACGYDACSFDPLSAQILGSPHYRVMTQQVMDAADRLCDGKLVVCHEGGYSAVYVPFCGVAVIETLMGQETGIHDPFATMITDLPYQELQPHQQAAVERAVQGGLAALESAMSEKV